jgi:outer membrane cobalamin receptor
MFKIFKHTSFAFLLLASLFTCYTTKAQTALSPTFPYTIKGIVVDSATKQPLSTVSVAVHYANYASAFKSSFTNAIGEFTVSSLPYRAYDLIISSNGYVTKKIYLPLASSDTVTPVILLASLSLEKKTDTIISKPVEKREETAPKPITPVILKDTIKISADTTNPALPYSIKGTVIDSATQEPLASVTIALHQANYKSPLKTAGTNEEGIFEIKSLPYRSYDIFISSIGYKTEKLYLPVSSTNTLHLNPITLSPLPNYLKEVKVLAKRNYLKYEADKIIYDVEKDPESAALNTFDLMRKLPMITIDGEDNIELNGNSGFQVLLNNRQSSLFVRNISDVFKSLPAKTIKSIEIITNPPAKYDAEGIAGIINIITYGKNLYGYNVSLRASYSHPGGPGTGGTITAKGGKVGFSGLWGYSNNASPFTNSSFYRQDKITKTVMQQNGQSRYISNNLYANGEINFQFNDQNLLAFHYNHNTNNGKSDFSQDVELVNNLGSVLQSYSNISKSNNNTLGRDFGVDFQRSFKKNTQQLLTFSVKQVSNINESISDNKLEPKTNTTLTGGHSNNESDFTERTAQVDYVQPIKKHVLEVGVKAIDRFSSSEYFFERLDAASGILILDPRLSSSYIQDQNIYIGYLSLSLKFGKWLFRTGSRYEQFHQENEFNATNTKSKQLYENFIPNISISGRLGKRTNISGSYTQRLQRPGLYYLNPFVDNRDPYNITFGNPDLQPTITHSGNLSVNTSFGTTSISTNLFHQFTNNSILRYTILGSDTVSKTTYGNIGEEMSTGASLGLNFLFFKKWNLNINSNANHRSYTSIINGELQQNEGLSYSVSGNTGYTVKGWRLGVNGGYTSPLIIVQGRNAGYVNHSASLTKSFLKKKTASIALNVSNPLQGTRENFSETETSMLYQVRNSTVIMRRYTLNFNYRFGKLTGSINRKKRGIVNDDIKSSD